VNDAFDKLTVWLDSLYGIPGVALVLLWCIGLGYFLKMTCLVQNKRIPIWVVCWGMLWNVLLRPLPKAVDGLNQAQQVWELIAHFGRLLAVGFLVGLVATLIYDKVLKQLEDKFPWLRDFLNTRNGETETTIESK
jgi:hypothetical protein